MIKILYYSELIADGGVEKMMYNWILNFSCEIKVSILTREVVSEEYRRLFQKQGCNIYEIKCGKYNYLEKIKFLKILLSEEKFNILHVNSMFALDFWLLLIAKKYNINNRIVHSHNAIEKFHKLSTRYIDRVSKPLLRYYATDYYACSKTALISLLGNKPMVIKKGIIIKNGIQIDQFKFSFVERSNVRKILSIAEDEYVIGTIGRLEEQKNYWFLIRLFEKLQNIEKKVKLLIIGGGSQEQRLHNYVNKHGLNVIFLGVRNDANRLLNAMDLFIVTSFFEGFPIVTVEAQTNGLNCIVSEAVPCEAILTTEITRLRVGFFENWLSQIEKQIYQTINYERRESSYVKIKECGYDILDSTRNLERKYHEMVKSYISEE